MERKRSVGVWLIIIIDFLVGISFIGFSIFSIRFLFVSLIGLVPFLALLLLGISFSLVAIRLYLFNPKARIESFILKIFLMLFGLALSPMAFMGSPVIISRFGIVIFVLSTGAMIYLTRPKVKEQFK